MLPVGWREKKPSMGDDWQVLAPTLTEAELARFFSKRSNVGVMLGTPSRHLVDIDLDCPEAIELAPYYLPATWTFGRPSKPRSHWEYISEGSIFKKYSDVTGATLVELRADKAGAPGKSGSQTVFPPSLHQSGERISWTEDCDGLEGPRIVAASELRGHVNRLVSACLVFRHAPRAAAVAWLHRGAACPSLCPPGCAHADTRTDGKPPCPTRMFRTLRGLENAQPQPKAPPPRRAGQATEEFPTAAAAYNRAHARELPSRGSQCPVCGSPDAFKHHDDNAERWVCWSRRHDAHGVGVYADTSAGPVWSGDFLDLDSHAARVDRATMLRRANYLKGR